MNHAVLCDYKIPETQEEFITVETIYNQHCAVVFLIFCLFLTRIQSTEFCLFGFCVFCEFYLRFQQIRNT
jgi:hypothetical protein